MIRSADGTGIECRTVDGDGPGVIVVGGALRTAEDYLPLVRALAETGAVHVMQRRGRGGSGPLGSQYTLDSEVDDLLAVQAATGAKLAFGHSFGGLVVLETARRHGTFERVAVYEPGVPAEPVATAWMGPYRERLEANDPHGAFAHFLRGSEGSPAFLKRLPQWYLSLALRVGFRGAAWRRMRPLLAANLAEHEQVAAQSGRLGGFAAVTAPVLVLQGGKTQEQMRRQYGELARTLPDATLDTMPGLDHFGPEGKGAPTVARRASAFLRR